MKGALQWDRIIITFICTHKVQFNVIFALIHVKNFMLAKHMMILRIESSAMTKGCF